MKKVLDNPQGVYDNGFMSMELKLSDVIKRAKLDARRTRYILEHPEHLAGMPEGGRQGAHRVFDLSQARRLAICAYLQSNGVALEIAGNVVDWTEGRTRQLRNLKVASNVDRLYPPSQGKPWVLKIIDFHWVNVWQDGIEHRFADEDDFFPIDDFKVADDREHMSEVNLVQINVSIIENWLARA